MSKSYNKKLFRKILWPGRKGVFDINHPEILSVLEPEREVNMDSRRYKSGSFYSVKSLRTIEHESGSERDFYLSLENNPAVAYYWHVHLNLKYRDFPFQISRGNQSPVFRDVYFGKIKYDEIVKERFPSIIKWITKLKTPIE